MDLVRSFLEQQPILTLFLVIGLGYALGELNLRGFSLGAGAVLFVGLAIGAFAPGAVPPALLQSVGLVLFFYGIGIQYGRQFFVGLTSSAGLRQNGLAMLGLLVGTLVAVGLLPLGIGINYASGLFAGALVSTGALQAALEATGSSQPLIGYSVSYPFGVFGTILAMSLALRLVKPQLNAPVAAGYTTLELRVSRADVIGKRIGELAQALPPGVQIAAIRHGEVNTIPQPTTQLAEGDNVLVMGPPGVVEQARQIFGPVVAPTMLDNPQGLEYFRVFVSRPTVAGRRIGDLRIAETLSAAVVNVRRGDAELHATPDLVLESGDRIGLVTQRSNFAKLRSFFGNSIKGTAEISYVSLGIGMVLGVLLGLITVPVPWLGSISLGLAGGPLLMSLLLGRLGRTGPITWSIPLTANLVLRTFGLTLFLASVGMRSGETFVTTVQSEGLQLLAAGAAITLAVVVSTLLIGHLLMRMPFDELLGVTAGVSGNPAILAFAARSVPTDKPDLSYAITFPTTTIAKILIVQLLVAIFGST